MGVTIKEIAEICGVSQGTVDRALNNRPGINPKTKTKILQVARELNYRPDHFARSLARGKSMTLGVVLFDLHNRSFAQLMNAVEARSRELGYFVHLVLTDKDPQLEMKYIEHLMARKVDGIILFTVNKGESFDRYLKNLNKPIVTICNRVSEHWPYIGIDDRQAMKDAVTFILQKGYKRVVYICPALAYQGKANIYTQEERLQGCIEGMREQCREGSLTVIREKDYLGALNQIELTGEEKTAVLCSCDYYALEVMNFLKAKGLKIPEDVGLMGFDNIDFIKYASPLLTTVEYAIEEIAERAVDCLISQVETGEAPPVPLLSYRVLPGGSV